MSGTSKERQIYNQINQKTRSPKGKKTKLGLRHRFHMVTRSAWPFLASIGALGTTVGAVMYFHHYSGGQYILIICFAYLGTIVCYWFRDIIREGTYQGHHTMCVQRGLRMGFILFIVSEVMFFFSFFWAFFHSALSPTPDLGCIWPPHGIVPFNPWTIPLVNTLILLTSGAAVTSAHYAILTGLQKPGLYVFALTIILAFIFTGFQAFEYLTAPFAISDGVYGSVFYMITGLHGFHVIIGTAFLCSMWCRYYCDHFTMWHHLGFEFAAWYWHFVDFVWIFVFLVIYWWGGYPADLDGLETLFSLQF